MWWKRTRKIAGYKMQKLMLICMVAMYCIVMLALPASAALVLDFDTNSMFTYAQLIVDALLPVMYIILGIALGFIIIRALKSAFS
jgi:hypothetical protein